MTQTYDQAFGVFDYFAQDRLEAITTDPNKKRPLATIEIHPAELNSGSDQKYDELTKAFSDLKISSNFGISWIDFMDLPVEQAERILRIAQESNAKFNAAQKGVLDQLNAAASDK